MKRLIRGRVYSNKGDKTIVVRVVMRQTHPLYKKQYTRHRKYMAHDAKNEAQVGDLVIIRESKPISARKRFILDKIVEKAGAEFKEADAAADVPMAELEKKQQPKKPAKPAPKAAKTERNDAAIGDGK
jgi:small subunit ribosomal protein S17